MVNVDSFAVPREALPVRTCVGCRQRATKPELLRVVAGTGDRGPTVVPDPRGGAPGRGAHLHPTTACLELAVRRRAFARALRVPAGTALDTAPLHEYLSTSSISSISTTSDYSDTSQRPSSTT